jgi:large subunit ribosomal protein L17
MAVIEFVDRDVEAKRVDRKKKDPAKDKIEEKKLATA